MASKGAGPERFLSTDHLESDLKRTTVLGGAVTIAAQIADLVLTLLSTVVLARLLTPNDFGVVAMVTVVIGFARVFADMGLSMATIQRSDVTHPQVSTLFWINASIGAFLTAVVAGLGPVLVWFYAEPRLVAVTIVLSSVFFVTGLGVQHQALLQRQMRFTGLAAVRILALGLSVVTAICAAYWGAGYWALVFMQLVNAFGLTLGVWILCGWRPSAPARGIGVRSMLAFGGNLAASNIFNYFARNIHQLLIGRVWGGSELGLYEQANRLLQTPMKKLTGPIGTVVVPALCRLQNDPERYRNYYLMCIRLLAFVTMPGMAFVVVMSDDLVAILLGDQWSEAAVIFSVLGLIGIIWPIGNTMGWHYIASATTHRMLRWGIFDSCMLIAGAVIGVSYGAIGVAVAFVVVRAVLFVPALFYATQDVSVSVTDILRAMRTPLVGCIAMGAALYGLGHLAPEAWSSWTRVIAAFLTGTFVYLSASCITTWSMAPVLELPKLAIAVFKSQSSGAPGDSDTAQ